jgi:uncharacterized protein
MAQRMAGLQGADRGVDDRRLTPCDGPRYDAAMRTILFTATLACLFAPAPSSAGSIHRIADSRLIPIQTPSGVAIQAEIADTPQKRATGLMYRDHLKKDHGMLFVFSEPQAWTFWMKNTKIPLDLIWMDAKKRVIYIERNVPICTRTDDSCPQYRPNDDALFVLEIAGGTVDGYKIENGSKLQFVQP